METRNNEVRYNNQPKVIAIAATRQMDVPVWGLALLGMLALMASMLG